MAVFKILSLDGGGSWALIQIRALMDLYGENATGHQVLSRFDLACANSGGTLTLAGLILDWPLSKALDVLRDPAQRKSIFVRSSFFKDPVSHISNAFGFGSKYDTGAKYDGLRKLLGPTGDVAVTQLDPKLPQGPAGQTVRVLLCGFDYDRNREVFFRSDAASLSSSAGPAGPGATLAQAIHASTNAPINYFDEPALGPVANGVPSRYWDGAVGGYNNPLMAGLVETLANAGRYNTDAASIRVLTIGTGNVVLPLAQGMPGENGVYMSPRPRSNLKDDVIKLASSILDDPPDAATFHAHVMLGCPMPTAGTALPINDRVLRLNPLIQPVLINGTTWDFPPGLSSDAFKAIRDLEMDAVEQADVDRIDAFCTLWLNGAIPNQPIRANGRTLQPEIGYARYPRQATLNLFP